jgi:hypothetical protein
MKTTSDAKKASTAEILPPWRQLYVDRIKVARKMMMTAAKRQLRKAVTIEDHIMEWAIDAVPARMAELVSDPAIEVCCPTCSQTMMGRALLDVGISACVQSMRTQTRDRREDLAPLVQRFADSLMDSLNSALEAQMGDAIRRDHRITHPDGGNA